MTRIRRSLPDRWAVAFRCSLRTRSTGLSRRAHDQTDCAGHVHDSFITTLHSRLTAARDTAVRAADTQQPAGHHEPGGSVGLTGEGCCRGLLLRQPIGARGTWSGRSTVIGESESARRAGARDARTVDLRDSSSLTGPRPALPREPLMDRQGGWGPAGRGWWSRDQSTNGGLRCRGTKCPRCWIAVG